MNSNIYRIIDANLNRVTEGLRVLEDLARLLLNDVEISRELKNYRHEISIAYDKLTIELLSNRDSENDVGKSLDFAGNHENIISIIRANSKRSQEGLRVIEEITKLPEIKNIINYEKFKILRFNIYNIERDLISKVLRKEKTARIKGLYIIFDLALIRHRDILEVCNQIIRGGASVLQLRDKSQNRARLLTIAYDLKDLCKENNILFIVNDYLDIALAVNADGIHLGQEDLPVPIARKELPIDKLIGCSVHTLEQARKANNEGADYIAVGSIFPTNTKENATVCGIDLLRDINNEIDLPIVAIGGINFSNVQEVISAGADSVAIASAILSQKDIESSTRLLISKIASL